MPCKIVASDETFSVGDVVQLISGGPKMTVDAVGKQGSRKAFVSCVWFAGAKVESRSFGPETLEKVPSAKSK